MKVAYGSEIPSAERIPRERLRALAQSAKLELKGEPSWQCGRTPGADCLSMLMLRGRPLRKRFRVLKCAHVPGSFLAEAFRIRSREKATAETSQGCLQS
jgi:hypothetical protein